MFLEPRQPQTVERAKCAVCEQPQKLGNGKTWGHWLCDECFARIDEAWPRYDDEHAALHYTKFVNDWVADERGKRRRS